MPPTIKQMVKSEAKLGAEKKEQFRVKVLTRERERKDWMSKILKESDRIIERYRDIKQRDSNIE